MCGIAGFTTPQHDAADIDGMVNAMSHRGPDGRGTWQGCSGDSHVFFGHSRLAILDLSNAARQPMIDPQTGCVLVYNGEIYNYADLRAQLPGEFLSSGDTEVVLRAYLRWGDAFVSRLRGMFALCIYDPRKSRLLLARDQLGIKPMYLTEGWGGRFAFASEVRSLLTLPWVGRSLDAGGLAGYLAYGSVQEPFTLISGIRSLPPGHTLAVKLGEGAPAIGRAQRFWQLPRVSGAQTPAAVREALAESVRCHMVSDVPVGAFLSGGVDSSAIVALMTETATSDVRTFTVSFDEAGSQDAAMARAVAERFGTRHTELQLSAEEFRSRIFDWLASQDQPSADGANSWIVSRACRQAGLTVALSGLGADELFAGYSTFSRMKLASRVAPVLSWIPVRARRALADAVQSRSSRSEKLAEWLPGDVTALSSYLTLRRIFPQSVSNQLLDPLFAALASTDLHPEVAARLRRESEGADPAAATSRFEIDTYLTSTLLRDSDQMGMAHSLEIRVPFVDTRVAGVALSMPGAAHTARGPKTMLRAAMAGSLDACWTDRPKEGFTLPFDSWLRKDLRKSVEEVLLGLSAFPFRAGQVARFWRAFQAGDGRAIGARVLTLVALGAWMKRHRVEACV